MYNVNQITAQLRGMPDQQLQQYAMMHKNDPYILPLVINESSTRKEMRTAAQAKMVGQQQPKVVDQSIAQMMAPPPQQMPQGQPQMPPQQAQQRLPEDSGIGQLPAPNMQRMADGGIVGYADTGLVETNKFVIPPQGIKDPQTGEIIKPESWNALPKSQQMRLVGVLRSQAGLAPVPTNAYPGIQYAQYGPSIEQWQQGIKNANPTMAQEREQNMAVVNAQAPTIERGRPTMAGDPRLLTSAAPIDTASGAPTGGGVNTLVAPPKTGAGANVAGGQDIKTQPPAGLPSVASFADQLMGIDKFLPKKEEAPVKETFMKEREDISRPVYEKATAMLEKEKSRLNEGKEQDFYMALIEGGLEAAAGNSPNGLQNLAAGFSKGAKSYSVALKDFRKAAQENSKMELDMERARAAEKRGDMDAFQKYDDSIKNRNADIDKLKTSGIFALQNVHTSGAYQLQSTGMTTSSQEKIAKLNRDTQVGIASMAGPQERLFATLGGGKDQASVLKGLQRFQEAQTDKTGLGFAKLYVDHVAESNKAGMTPMTEGVFLDTMTRLASQFNPKTVTDPGKGTVLDRPR